MDSIFSDWPGGSLESALKLGGLLLLVYGLILWFSAIIWTYSDVRHRTTDQFSQAVAVLLVAIFNLPGLVVYLVIRPQTTLADTYERSLESESLLHELQLTANSCQACQRPIDDDFNICPFCRTMLREPCRNCARSIRTSWMACPYCATDRPQPRPVEAEPAISRRPLRGREESQPAEPQAARQTRAQTLERPMRTVESPSDTENATGAEERTDEPAEPQPRLRPSSQPPPQAQPEPQPARPRRPTVPREG